MISDFRVSGANYAKVVNGLADPGKDLTHFKSTLTVLLEAVRRAHQVAGRAICYYLWSGHRLTMVLGKHWLRIETVQVRKPAIEEQKNHILGFCREVWRPARPTMPNPLPTILSASRR